MGLVKSPTRIRTGMSTSSCSLRRRSSSSCSHPYFIQLRCKNEESDVRIPAHSGGGWVTTAILMICASFRLLFLHTADGRFLFGFPLLWWRSLLLFQSPRWYIRHFARIHDPSVQLFQRFIQIIIIRIPILDQELL